MHLVWISYILSFVVLLAMSYYVKGKKIDQTELKICSTCGIVAIMSVLFGALVNIVSFFLFIFKSLIRGIVIICKYVKYKNKIKPQTEP